MTTLTDNDIINLYNSGYYNICKQLLLGNVNVNGNFQPAMISLILGNPKPQSVNINLGSSTLDSLLLGTWNLSFCDQSVDSLFSSGNSTGSMNNTGSTNNTGNMNGMTGLNAVTGQIYQFHNDQSNNKNIETGISLLEKINNQHSNYILFKYYISTQQSTLANSCLMTSAKLGCADAITDLNSLGLQVDTTDQCFDHCLVYCGTDDVPRKCGCGPYKTGWIFGSCLTCGCKTSLSCIDFANYASSGFIGLLQSIYQPLKLSACVASIVVLGLQQSGSTHLSVAIFLSTSLTTLVTFINKDIQQQNNNN